MYWVPFSHIYVLFFTLFSDIWRTDRRYVSLGTPAKVFRATIFNINKFQSPRGAQLRRFICYFSRRKICPAECKAPGVHANSLTIQCFVFAHRGEPGRGSSAGTQSPIGFRTLDQPEQSLVHPATVAGRRKERSIMLKNVHDKKKNEQTNEKKVRKFHSTTCTIHFYISGSLLPSRGIKG